MSEYSLEDWAQHGCFHYFQCQLCRVTCFTDRDDDKDVCRPTSSLSSESNSGNACNPVIELWPGDPSIEISQGLQAYLLRKSPELLTCSQSAPCASLSGRTTFLLKQLCFHKVKDGRAGFYIPVPSSSFLFSMSGTYTPIQSWDLYFEQHRLSRNSKG